MITITIAARRPAAALAVAAALVGTAYAGPLDCFALSANWVAHPAKSNTSSNYYVVDTFRDTCYDVLTSQVTHCKTGHYFTVSYRNPDGTWTQITLPSRAQHVHEVICGSFKAINLERTNLGGICGWKPGAPIRIVDVLYDNPTDVAGPPPKPAPGDLLTGVRHKTWTFKCPPLVQGPGPGDPGGTTP